MNDFFIREIFIDNYDIPKDNYIFKLPVVKNINNIKLNKKVTFFVGENGSGKSTLLEAIAIAFGFNAEGGSRNFNFSTTKTHSDLYKYLKLVRGVFQPKDGYFLRAESFYNVASNIDELDKIMTFSPPIKNSYGGKSLHNQSHGESFLSLILNRFSGNGLYILDEPEAALSVSRLLTLISRINQLVNENSQFIISTHSPILMAYPDADIYVLNDEGITLTPYTETEQYLLTRRFLENPEKMLSYLID